MPTYEYRCVSCEHQFERFQRMSDDPVKECEVCGAPVKRLLFPVAIHFKGSGFYSTDYAHRNAHPAGGSNSGNGASSDSSSDSASTSSETAPPSNGSGEKPKSKTADAAPASVAASAAKTD